MDERAGWSLPRRDLRVRNLVATVSLLLWVFCAAGSGSARAWAQDELKEAEVRTFREWEGFDVHSWKQVRVIREAFDDRGEVASSSTADTRTTLIAVDDQGFTLQAEVTVELAGKRFTEQPRVVWYGHHGQGKGRSVTAEKVAVEPVEINGRKYDTDVFKIAIREGTLERQTSAHCSDVFPYVLRKRSTLADPAQPAAREQDRLTVDVVAVDLPFRVLSELKSASYVRTTLRRSDAQTVTLEVHCQDVPGQVVAHWSTTTNAEGRLVERSTLELVDFGAGAEPMAQEQPGIRRPLFRRNPIRRTR